ncbi:DUF7002 family protein [Roseicyclus sp.]
MIPESILSRLGPRLYHVTAQDNAVAISKAGLLTPREIAKRAGLPEDSLILRTDRCEIVFGNHRAILNHQRPLRAGMNSRFGWLDGCTVEDWARQLDTRVFFWVDRPDAAFLESVAEDLPVSAFSICTKALLDRFPEFVWLSPINSGSAKRRPSTRGTWLYVSAKAGWNDFRENRRRRGLVSKADSAVKEISVTRSISPGDLAVLDWRREEL